MILATLCYVRRGGKTLMLHRVKKKNDMHWGKWNGLGGKMHAGETPEECVVREVREESGLTLQGPALRGVITFPAFDDIDDWLVFVFTAHRFKGGLTESPEGHLAWVRNRDLPRLPLWEGDRVFMKWLDKKPFFSAKLIYKSGRFIRHRVVFYR